MPDNLIGQVLDHYQIVRLLDESPTGSVFRARDLTLQRDVAVKVLPSHFADQPAFQERFLRAARTAAQLDHPNIVQVLDFGRDRGALYIVMEALWGDTLRQLLSTLKEQGQWLVLPEAVGIVRQLCLALAHAHRQGVLHRSVRPADIMFQREPSDNLLYRPVLIDLGLETLEIDGEPLLINERRAYSPYLSPEQLAGDPTSVRSDVYALGALLYELAAGQPPPAAQEFWVGAEAREASQPPRAMRPEIPEPVEQVILQALARDPAGRFASPAEMAEALERVSSLAAYSLPQGAISLMPLLQSAQDESRQRAPARSSGGPAPDIRRDRVQVFEPDQTARTVPITGRGLLIGRAPENDVVLGDPEVSEQHARVDFDGAHYRVTDLNSTNGTFVNDRKLLPGVPETWAPDKSLRVGRTWLRLEIEQLAVPAPMAEAEPDSKELEHVASTEPKPFLVNGQPIDENLIEKSPPPAWVGIYADVLQFSVVPGQTLNFQVVVFNHGPQADRLAVSLSGVPAQWLPTPPPTLSLAPGAHEVVKITVQPPRSPGSRAGRYPVVIRAASRKDPQQVADLKLTLTVAAYSHFTSAVHPAQMNADEWAQLSIQNQGNTQETFTLAWYDPADELAFELPPVQITVPEGQAAVAEFRARPKFARLIGGLRVHPFTSQVIAPSGQTQTHTAEVLSRAMVPVWIPPIALIMCLLLAGALGLIYSDFTSRQDSATQAAFANQTAAAAAADPDGDGLTNSEEAARGTDPANPDTDGDGLPDGQERFYGADPLNADTDGDTLSDGREVLELGTSPISQDTDGDGLLDNVDPDPGALPTPTPTFTLTPLPTDTPLPSETPLPSLTPLPATETLTPPPTETVAAPTDTAPPPSPLPGAAAGVLLIESQRDGNTEIYTTSANGSAAARLTTNLSDDTNPRWSPNGIWIVFESTRDGNPEIYLMNADGSGQVRLTTNTTSDTNPVFAPDSIRVAFVSERDGNNEIYVMNADGSAQTRLTNDPGNDCCLAWSPAGTQLAFTSDRGGSPGLYVMNADGSAQTRLADALLAPPAWSPDGGRLAFISGRDGNHEIYVINADGTGEVRLTSNTALDSLPVWSPDGLRLAFLSERDGNTEVYLMGSDGSAQTRLTANTAAECCLLWAPNSQHLAYASNRDGNFEIYVAAVNGTGEYRLTSNSAYDAPFGWRQ